MVDECELFCGDGNVSARLRVLLPILDTLMETFYSRIVKGPYPEIRRIENYRTVSQQYDKLI